jgi:Tol biopolymer transport system component
VIVRPRYAVPALLSLVCVAAVVLSACGGSPAASKNGSPAGEATEGPAAGTGSLILTRPDGIAEINLKSHDEKLLIKQPTSDTFLLDPAVSPDGGSIAYTLQPPPKVQGTTYDAGSDIWIATRDGSGAHQVVAHQEPNQLMRYPGWLDAGHLLAVVQEPTVAEGTTSVKYVLEKIDIATGQRTRMIENVLAYGLSPDRTRVVYTELGTDTGETLKTAALDGSDAKTIVGPEQNLLPFNSPRYSPDGSTVAFTSADQTGARAGWRYVSARPASVSPDGLPEDVWTVASSGGLARRVADIKEDLPALTWGADGSHLYVLGAMGLSDVSLKSGAVKRIADGSFHGEIAWAP